MNTINIQVPTNSQVPQIHTTTAQELMNYTGMFSFLLDLRNKFLKYGKLSDAQWSAARRVFDKTAAIRKPKYEAKVGEAGIPVLIPLTVSAVAARVISKSIQAVQGMRFNPRTFTVTEIRSASKDGYLVRGKIDWTSSTKDCRCCGKALTDWRSQATGVGPVCVKGTPIPYVKTQADVARFQKEMQDFCDKIGTVEFFVKKYAIISNSLHFENAVDSFLQTYASHSAAAISSSNAISNNITQAIASSVVSSGTETTVPIESCKYDETKKTFVLSNGVQEFAIYTYDAIRIYNHKTKASRKFVKTSKDNRNVMLSAVTFEPDGYVYTYISNDQTPTLYLEVRTK